MVGQYGTGAVFGGQECIGYGGMEVCNAGEDRQRL